MKRFGNLYDKICDQANLYAAYIKAREGKVNSYGVRFFECDFEKNMKNIHAELLDGTYKTPEYEIFKIYEPKERVIFRLPFKDRIVHHAIMNVIGSIWSSIFISQTYSSIKGKGIHPALRDIKRDLKDIENTTYCLKTDIRKFYPSIDHDVLKAIIRKKIKDVRLLKLLDSIIDSAPGVPIGNYLSQFFANLYLSYFDHWLKEDVKVKYYYRYADDMVILSGKKEILHGLRKDISRYLFERLHINLKDNWQVFPVDDRGIDFVGYVIRHSHVRMRKSIKKNFARKAAKFNKMNISAKEYKIKIAPWVGWANHCDSRHLIKKIIKNEEVLGFWD